MKKITIRLFILTCIICMATSSYANEFKINETELDALFEQSEDVSATFTTDFITLASGVKPTQELQGGKTVEGFLVRCFFCGGIALHRTYMGGKGLWWKYMCVPVAGQVAFFVDFWWVIIEGDKALKKYSGNDVFFVWL